MCWLVGIVLGVIDFAGRHSTGPAHNLAVDQRALVPRIAKMAKLTCSMEDARFEVPSRKDDAQ